ncbi:MAG: RimK/LysX family protein [Cyanobacteria bacterium P01_D01_bin.128]
MMSNLPLIGWREWLTLPELGVDQVKAKIDTGARSSALHVLNLDFFERDGQSWATFQVFENYATQQSTDAVEMILTDQRHIKNSGGQIEYRPIVRTAVTLGRQSWDIELSLTTRESMRFPMLLGRQAVRGRFWVDPGRSFLHGSIPSPRQSSSAR